MNIWYISSLIIVGLGIIILVGCILGTIFTIKKIINVLNGTVQCIQQQMQPIETQMNLLNATANRLMLDVNLKKSDVVEATDSCRDLVRNIKQLLLSSRLSTKQIVDKIDNDPQKQAQTVQWTNTVMRFLKRNV